MKKNKLVKMIMVMFFAGVCLLGFGSKADAAVNVLNWDQYKTPLVSVGAWGPDASYDVFDVKKSESWGREDSRGFLAAFQDQPQGYINYDVYFITSGNTLVYNNSQVFRWVNGWNPPFPIASTVNKDKDRFERKTDGSYKTLGDFGISNNDRPSNQKGKITVGNYGRYVDVSISKWHNSEDGSNFRLKGGESDSWSRSTARGNLMVIDNKHKYYVKPGEAISVFDSSSDILVFVDGKKINKIPTN